MKTFLSTVKRIKQKFEIKSSVKRKDCSGRPRAGFPKVVHMDPLGAILTIRGAIEVGKRKRFKINKQRN